MSKISKVEHVRRLFVSYHLIIAEIGTQEAMEEIAAKFADLIFYSLDISPEGEIDPEAFTADALADLAANEHGPN